MKGVWSGIWLLILASRLPFGCNYRYLGSLNRKSPVQRPVWVSLKTISKWNLKERAEGITQYCSTGLIYTRSWIQPKAIKKISVFQVCLTILKLYVPSNRTKYMRLKLVNLVRKNRWISYHSWGLQHPSTSMWQIQKLADK